MAIRVGINGFGRMGRLVLRAGWAAEHIEFVHINDPLIGLEEAAHLLEFDSVHGRWRNNIVIRDGQLVIDGASLSFRPSQKNKYTGWPASYSRKSTRFCIIIFLD